MYKKWAKHGGGFSYLYSLAGYLVSVTLAAMGLSGGGLGCCGAR